MITTDTTDLDAPAVAWRRHLHQNEDGRETPARRAARPGDPR